MGIYGKKIWTYLKFSQIKIRVRRLGSASIDICHVATDQADGFWEYDLAPWDSAAGILIAKESGCTVSQLNGSEYSIYDNNILVTNGRIHKEMVEEFKKLFKLIPELFSDHKPTILSIEIFFLLM